MGSVIQEHQQHIEKRWEHEGIECVILIHPRRSHRNGYVRVPNLDKLPSVEHGWELLFEAHGGITYGPDEEGWVGFDTAHGFDYWPDLAGETNPLTGLRNVLFDDIEDRYRTDWTVEKLEEETNRLAEQVAKLSRG